MTNTDPTDRIEQLAEDHRIALLVHMLEPSLEHAAMVQDAWAHFVAAAGPTNAQAIYDRLGSPLVDSADTLDDGA